MELVRAVTNEELSPNYFINHLRSNVYEYCWNITLWEFG